MVVALNENPNNLPVPSACSATLSDQSPGTRSVPTTLAIVKLFGVSEKSNWTPPIGSTLVSDTDIVASSPDITSSISDNETTTVDIGVAVAVFEKSDSLSSSNTEVTL